MQTLTNKSRNFHKSNKQNKQSGGFKAPIRSLGSNFEMVNQAMLIEPEYNKKHWSNMRRVPHALKIAREIENYKNEIALATGRAGITGIKKSFVVFKKKNNLYRAIGIGEQKRGFKTIDACKKFVRKIGRTHLRYGAIVCDVNA